jgi:hypothetical protein
MHRSIIVLALSVAALVGCAGATDNELDDDVDLPDDFDSVSQGLSTGGVEVDPEHEASGDHERDCEGHHGKHKRGNRLHHLFKRLDRLDGEKDKQIVIASLPDRVPDRLIEKLRTIDANNDGIVTKDEVKAARKAHKQARQHD